MNMARSSWAAVAALACASLGSVCAAAERREAGWLDGVAERIERAEYRFSTREDGTVSAPNRAHDLRASVAARGIAVVSRTAGAARFELTLSLVRWGRKAALATIDPQATLDVRGQRVQILRRDLTESYVNDERGLEQRFVLHAPPAGEGPLVLELSLGGSAGAFPEGDGRAILFKDALGRPAVRWSALRVTDAAGVAVAARLTARRGVVRIETIDADAVYPLTVEALVASPVWTAESNQADAQFGLSVATAGDVNGDGYSDVLVGAFGYDHGQSGEGAAFVYLGSAAGLAGEPAWIAEGDQVAAHFGWSVAPAGDVNGDGFADVLVGAELYDNGETNEGRALVYLGSAAGLAAGPAWSADGDQSFAFFGRSVAPAGDVNGDGYADVLVGAELYDNGETNEGRALLYLGSAAGVDPLPSWTVEGDQVIANLGHAVAPAGDVNGDGFADVIVGVFGYDNGQVDEGRALVYLGSAAGLGASPAWSAEGNQANALFGSSVAAAGDVNGDGFGDVLIGAIQFHNGQVNEGRAYLYLGSATGPGASPAWTAEGDQTEALFGSSVATAGDVNGDGFADVVVGAYQYDNGQVNEGRAYVYLGSAAGLAPTPAWTTEGDQPEAWLGYSVATAGDVNGDGFSEVIVGAFLYDNGETNEGRAFVFRGSAAGPSRDPAWTAEGDQGHAGLGTSVATAGDVNGDGFSDVVVGASGQDNGEINEGRAYLYLGSAQGLASSPAWTAEGDQAGALFGSSVATAGDVNGDGFADVLVGAPGAERAALYLGSAQGLAASPAWSAAGDRAGALFGSSVAFAGDVNGDGFADVLVGAPGAERAALYLGSAQGLAAAPAWSTEGDQGGALFGGSVATAGDVNGDGFSDVLVGAAGHDNGELDLGRAYLFLGSAPGLAAAPAWTAEGDQVGAAFGGSVATAGDVNGDGFADVLVGAAGYDNGQINEGRAYVYLGSGQGLGSSPVWTAEGDQGGALFGGAVAAAGDVNGDGFADVLVGAALYDHGQLDEGRAYVYLGSASGPGGLRPWRVEGDQIAARLGSAVAAAGDVNGDGFADVLVGARGFSAGRGGVQLYPGGGGAGLARAARQARSDGTAPVGLLGMSDASDAFRLRLRGRTPRGRGSVRMEYEIKPLGVPFDGTLGSTRAVDTGSPDAGGSFYDGFDELVTGLSPGPHVWRVRLASDDPFFPRSPWLSLPGNARTETDLRLCPLCPALGSGE